MIRETESRVSYLQYLTTLSRAPALAVHGRLGPRDQNAST